MITKESYIYYGSLIACFSVSALTCLTVILTAPSASLLGIFLQGLLIALGATGYGLLIFGCIVVAGLIAVALGCLVQHIIRAFQSKSQKLQDNNILILGTEMEQKEKKLTETEPRLSQIEKEAINEIRKLKKWGKAVAKTLYEKTLNREEKEVEEILKNNLEILVKDYKRLAMMCHPDTEFDISQKAWRTKAFQKLGNARESTRKRWELALCGVNPEEPEAAVTDIDMEKIRLLKEQNELLKKCIKSLQEVYEKLDEMVAKELAVCLSKENIAEFKTGLKADIKANIKADLKADIKAGLKADIKAELKPEIEANQNSPSFFQSMGQGVRSKVSSVIQSEQLSSNSIGLEEIEQEPQSLTLETNIETDDPEAVIMTEVKDHDALQETGRIFWARQKAVELKQSVCSNLSEVYESASNKFSSLWG